MMQSCDLAFLRVHGVQYVHVTFQASYRSTASLATPSCPSRMDSMAGGTQQVLAYYKATLVSIHNLSVSSVVLSKYDHMELNAVSSSLRGLLWCSML